MSEENHERSSEYKRRMEQIESDLLSYPLVTAIYNCNGKDNAEDGNSEIDTDCDSQEEYDHNFLLGALLPTVEVKTAKSPQREKRQVPVVQPAQSDAEKSTAVPIQTAKEKKQPPVSHVEQFGSNDKVGPGFIQSRKLIGKCEAVEAESIPTTPYKSPVPRHSKGSSKPTKPTWRLLHPDISKSGSTTANRGPQFESIARRSNNCNKSRAGKVTTDAAALVGVNSRQQDTKMPSISNSDEEGNVSESLRPADISLRLPSSPTNCNAARLSNSLPQRANRRFHAKIEACTPEQKKPGIDQSKQLSELYYSKKLEACESIGKLLWFTDSKFQKEWSHQAQAIPSENLKGDEAKQGHVFQASNLFGGKSLPWKGKFIEGLLGSHKIPTPADHGYSTTFKFKLMMMQLMDGRIAPESHLLTNSQEDSVTICPRTPPRVGLTKQNNSCTFVKGSNGLSRHDATALATGRSNLRRFRPKSRERKHVTPCATQTSTESIDVPSIPSRKNVDDRPLHPVFAHASPAGCEMSFEISGWK